MAWVTTWLAVLSFLVGCAALVFGVRVGHGSGELAAHFGWGVVALLLQLFTAATAAVHARARGREIASLRATLGAGEGARRGPEGTDRS